MCKAKSGYFLKEEMEINKTTTFLFETMVLDVSNTSLHFFLDKVSRQRSHLSSSLVVLALR